MRIWPAAYLPQIRFPTGHLGDEHGHEFDNEGSLELREVERGKRDGSGRDFESKQLYIGNVCRRTLRPSYWDSLHFM